MLAEPASTRKTAGIYDSTAMTAMRDVIDAVCDELGIDEADVTRREAVAERVMRAWAGGRRTPLQLVDAGLEAMRSA